MTLARRICWGERGDFREICAVEITTSSNNFSYFLSDLNLVAIQQHFFAKDRILSDFIQMFASPKMMTAVIRASTSDRFAPDRKRRNTVA